MYGDWIISRSSGISLVSIVLEKLNGFLPFENSNDGFLSSENVNDGFFFSMFSDNSKNGFLSSEDSNDGI